MQILFLLFSIFYALLAWRNLALALGVLLFALPAYQIRLRLGFLPTNVLEIMVLAVFATWLIKAIFNKKLPLANYLFFGSKLKDKNFSPYPFGKEIALLLTIAFLATMTAGFSSASLGILKAYFIEPVMFFIVFINIFKKQANRLYVFWPLSLSALMVSAIAVYQKISGQLWPVAWADSDRVTGVFAYPNALGLYLGPIIFVLAGYLLYLIKIKKAFFWPKIILFLSVVMSIATVFLAKSEGALIGMVVVLILSVLLCGQKSRKFTVGFLFILCVIISLNVSWREPLVKKIALMDTDGQIRRQLWSETWQMLNSGYFITGAGLANYQNAIKPFHHSGIYVRNDDPEFDKWVAISLEYQQQVWQPLEIYLYPHNIFLNFWTELGLAGMLLFVWLVIKFFVISAQTLNSTNHDARRWLSIALIGAMTLIIIHGLVDAPYFKNDLAIIFWLLLGMVGIYRMEEIKN